MKNDINVLITGSGCQVSKHLRNILEQCRKQDEALNTMKNMADILGMTVEEYANEIEIIGGYPEFSYELLEKLSNLCDQPYIIPKKAFLILKRE